MHVAKPIINKRPPIQPTTLIMFRKNMALIVKTCSSQERFDKSKPFGNWELLAGIRALLRCGRQRDVDYPFQASCVHHRCGASRGK